MIAVLQIMPNGWGYGAYRSLVFNFSIFRYVNLMLNRHIYK